MFIRKPVNRTIYADDFQNKAYSFVVESVLGPEQHAGLLVLSTSVGYLLTTSPTGQPKREQVIQYCRQPDESWLATAVVTVLAAEELPVNGTVVIRDSDAETVVLTINPVFTSLERLTTPSLTINEQVLRFTGTPSGEPSFQVLSITQQHSNEPVTITTDAPDYFQLASDSQPAFTSALTVTPSPLGTYIHVRYAASKYGSHEGQLTIQNSVGKETVTLNGHNAGLLNLFGFFDRDTLTGKKVVLLGLALVTGLVCAGYNYRCWLFPALCQNEALTRAMNKTPILTPVNDSRDLTARKIASRAPERTTVDKSTEPSSRRASDRSSANRSDNQLTNTNNVSNEQNKVASPRPVVRSSTSSKPTSQTGSDTVGKRPRRRVLVPAAPSQESELERELNRGSEN